MSFKDLFNNSVAELATYTHIGVTSAKRHPACTTCYKLTSGITISKAFKRLFVWISKKHKAETYSGYSISAFNLYLDTFRKEVGKGPLDQAASLAQRLLLSFTFRERPNLPLVSAYIFNLTERTNYFNNRIHKSLLDSVTKKLQEKHPTLFTTTPTMTAATGADIQAALEGIFGVGGAAFLSHSTGSIKIDPFYGRNNEDPIA